MTDINSVLGAHFVRALIENVCGGNIEIIKRPASFVLKSKEEGERDVKRIILLPPKGFTADAFNQMNSHDEAEKATIKINGGVRPEKNGFSTIRDCLLVASFNKNAKANDLDKPYMLFDLDETTPELSLELHSAREAPFSVVKSNGEGFYHNLINVSDDWVVLTLNKRLRPQRTVDLESVLDGLPEEKVDILRSFYGEVLKEGDSMFKKAPDLINQIVNMPLSQNLPALGEMLYVYDSGRHEACSVFAVILKIGKNYPEQVMSFLEDSIQNNSVPSYYAEQLIEKIRNFEGYDTNIKHHQL